MCCEQDFFFLIKIYGFGHEAWDSEIGSLTSLDASQVTQPVTSENQLHCTRLFEGALSQLLLAYCTTLGCQEVQWSKH